MRKGFFITLEGPEGCGKTTQALSLGARLSERGLNVITVREPGGSPIGEKIRNLLLSAVEGAIDPIAEVMLFEASRAQLVSTVIRPHLQSGGVVICDRYFDSTLAYQGYGRRALELGDITRANRIATGALYPDLTFLLDIDVEIGLSRKNKSGEWNHMDGESIGFHQRVRQGFVEIAEDDEVHFKAGRWVKIDAALPIDAIKHVIDAIAYGRIAQKFSSYPEAGTL